MTSLPAQLRSTGRISGLPLTAAIDPVPALDADILAQAGLNAGDFSVDNGSNGNATHAAAIMALTGNGPEPATWALVIGGSGVGGGCLCQ